MSKTLDLPSGKFWTVVRLTPDAPRTHYATTFEIDYPYRYSRVKITRLFRWGLVSGRWHDREFEVDKHLLMALGGRELGER